MEMNTLEVKPGDLLFYGDEYGIYLREDKKFRDSYTHYCYWFWQHKTYYDDSSFSRETILTVNKFRQNFLDKHGL